MSTNSEDEQDDLSNDKILDDNSPVEAASVDGGNGAAALQGDDEDDFAFQLRLEAEERMRQANQPQAEPNQNGTATLATTADSGVVATASGGYVYTDPNDGTVYEYDYERKAWIPKVDDDFIARYQAGYGVYDQEQQAAMAQRNAETQPATAPKPSQAEHVKERERPPDDLDEEGKKEWMKQRKKEKRKLAAERQRQQAHWFDMDESNNTNVYVSGLPSDIGLQEFEEIMTKYGVIARDPETKKAKLKLYLDGEGNPKGDGLCCYVKKESVELAMQILDGSDVRGNKLTVEEAHFEQKGDYDPSKKRKKLSSKQKKRLQEKQEKMFDWRPEKQRGERPKSDCTVIVRRLFTPEELTHNYAALQDSFKAQCSKYGEVKKVVFYENNPDGVVAVTFKDAESADDCIRMMDYRHFQGKQLRAERWDGKTKYNVEETEEERNRRLANWRKYLEATAATDDNSIRQGETSGESV